MFYGKGAGKFPTASAVSADVIAAARKMERAGYRPWQPNRPESVASLDDLSSRWYVRLAHGALADAQRLIYGRVDAAERTYTTNQSMTRPQMEALLADLPVLAAIRVLD